MAYNVTYDLKAQNTGADNPLVVGVSVFKADGTTFVSDLHWFVITDIAQANVGIHCPGGVIVTSGVSLSAGTTYQAKARAWKSYSLTPGGGIPNAVKLFDLTISGTVVGAVYQAGTGAAYGNSIGDGIYLDQETYNFTSGVAQYSANVYELSCYTV